MSTAILSLLFALALTLVVETVFALILGVREKHDFFCIFLINIITNLTLNSVMLPINYMLEGNIVAICSIIAVLEIAVVICEYLYYKKNLIYGKVHPLTLSVILNVASFSLGLVIMPIIF